MDNTKRVERVIKSLEKNIMVGYYVEDEKEALDKIKRTFKRRNYNYCWRIRKFIWGNRSYRFLRKGNYNF